jgi:hypothetical protein
MEFEAHIAEIDSAAKKYKNYKNLIFERGQKAGRRRSAGQAIRRNTPFSSISCGPRAMHHLGGRRRSGSL